MGRVILEHPDGRRIAADEADIEDATKNPHNLGSQVVTNDGRVYSQPARPPDDHVSLIDEGFVIVADIAERDQTVTVKDSEGNEVEQVIHAGHEIPRDQDLYRGKGLRQASSPSSLGRAVARKERQ